MSKVLRHGRENVASEVMRLCALRAEGFLPRPLVLINARSASAIRRCDGKAAFRQVGGKPHGFAIRRPGEL